MQVHNKNEPLIFLEKECNSSAHIHFILNIKKDHDSSCLKNWKFEKQTSLQKLIIGWRLQFFLFKWWHKFLWCNCIEEMRLPIQRMELKQNDPFYSLKKRKEMAAHQSNRQITDLVLLSLKSLLWNEQFDWHVLTFHSSFFFYFYLLLFFFSDKKIWLANNVCEIDESD